MTYEELQAAARKKPDAIWIAPASVRSIAIAFQSLARQPASLGWIENGIKSGAMSVYGIPVRVYEMV